jgi:hypothetical protein
MVSSEPTRARHRGAEAGMVPDTSRTFNESEVPEWATTMGLGTM